MLSEYRRLQSGSILDWGGEVPALIGAEYGRFLDLSQLWSLAGKTGDWSEAVRQSVPDPLPRGMVLATIDTTGVTLRTGPLAFLLPGMTSDVGVLLDSRVGGDCSIAVAGQPVRVRAGTARLASATISHDDPTT